MPAEYTSTLVHCCCITHKRSSETWLKGLPFGPAREVLLCSGQQPPGSALGCSCSCTQTASAVGSTLAGLTSEGYCCMLGEVTSFCSTCGGSHCQWCLRGARQVMHVPKLRPASPLPVTIGKAAAACLMLVQLKFMPCTPHARLCEH